jgi:hypothetical protein
MVAFKRQSLIQCEQAIISRRSAQHSNIQFTPRGFGIPPAHDVAVPATQHSQHYGERAITQLDYDGAQTVRSENFIPPPHRSLSRSRSRHRRGSRPSSKAPDITIQRKRCSAYLLAIFLCFDSTVNHEWGRAHAIWLPQPSSRPTSS